MNIVTYEGLSRFHENVKTHFVGNDSFDAYKQQTSELIASINDELKDVTGLDGTNFVGIYSDATDIQHVLSEGQLSGWALVGPDLAHLVLHTTTTGNSGWREWDKTYDFTDFSDIKASLAGLSLSTPMSEEAWDALTNGGTSSANLMPDTIYMVYE